MSGTGKTEQADLAALVQAMDALTATSRTMEEAYRRLEAQVREMDRELAEKHRELAFTTDYLTNLLESMSDGVVAVDNDGVITRFNRAACTILGYTAEEVTGRPFEEVFDRAFAAPRNPGMQELRTRSGRQAPLSERDSPVSDRAGNHVGSVKTFEDLSELIALREQVRQMDRLAAVGEMAATVAHEIRNPLGGIRGFAAFLSQDIPEDDPRRRLVDKIEAGAKSLEKVVNGLLEYTRPVELSLKPVGAAGLVDAALGYVNHDPARLTVENRIAPDLRVLADADKVRQIFLNILLNASQSLDGAGRIDIRAAADSGEVTIAFQDSGPGIAEDELDRVFSPFYTTKEKGTGLGLAVCRKIVEGHGGALWAESRAGEGATFHVRLPRAE